MNRIDAAKKFRARVNVAMLGAVQSGAVTAEAAAQVADGFRAGVAYAVGETCAYGGRLYRCVQAHTTQADWTPDAVPALWARMSTQTVIDGESYPVWVQPAGAHDAYSTGDMVAYNGVVYECTADGNVWPPDTGAGWIVKA